MTLKKLSAIAVSLSLTIGALSIPDHFSSVNNYNVIAATVPEDAPKSLADIKDTSSWYYQSCPTIGDVKALCFLVDFPDVRNQNSTLTAEAMEECLNGVPPTEDIHDFNDDMRDYVSEYYKTSSYGKFNIDFDVYGWYTFKNNRDYCGDVIGRENMLREVMEAYDDEIDYSEYDANNDGMLDMVYLFYAGPTDGNFWWSYVANGLGITSFDEETIPKFAFINLSSSTCDNYIEQRDLYTITHETGHILGLDDYYDVDDRHGGMGCFDMMDQNMGDHNIFSKMMLGWVDPVFVTEDMTFDVNCVSDETAKAYIIAPDFKNGVYSEYFIVEFYKSIKNNKYSANCPDGAVRIYHVDATYDNDNKKFKYDNNTTDHPLINLVESDGEYANLRYENAAYINDYYTEGMTFGINTVPSTEFYDGDFTGINITVNSIDGDSANVSVTFNNVDKEAPEMTKYTMPNAFGRVTYTSTTQVYFSSNIAKGDNFDKISIAKAVSPEEKIYPYCNVNYHPQNTVYGLNSLSINEDIEMSADTDYILTIPAGAVVDSSGNPNEEITIKFTSYSGTGSYSKTEYPDNFEEMPADAPEGSEMRSYVKIFPLMNGNVLYVHNIVKAIDEYTGILHGYDIKIYTPDFKLFSHLYLSNEEKGGVINVFELDNDTILFATEDNLYCIINPDGTMKEQGKYCDYETIYSDTSEHVIFENSIDFIDGNVDESEFYICRFNFDGTIERFGPIPIPENLYKPYTYQIADVLYRYNSDYTEYDPNKQLDVIETYNTESFYKSKYDEDVIYNRLFIRRLFSWALKDGDTFYYNSSGIFDTSMGIGIDAFGQKLHDTEMLCSKISKNGFPLIDADGGYVGSTFGVNSIILDDGLLIIYSMKGDGAYEPTGEYLYVRLNKDLEVMWDCAVPFYPNSVFCSGDKIYAFSNDGIYAFDDSATEPIFAKDEVIFTDTFEVDTENQEIKGGITTAEQLKTNLVASDADVIIYDLDGRTIPDSENIEEAIVEINIHNSAYTYYYHYISAEKYNISGTITTGSDDLSDVKVELLDSEGELVQTAQITDTGYEFTDVEQGKYTIVVSAPKYCTKEYSVEIGEENLELDVEIHLYADVNFDGIIDSKDATQILHYSSQVVSLFSSDDEFTSEYRFKVADVDQNEIIDSKDATQVLRYASDLPSLLDNL